MAKNEIDIAAIENRIAAAFDASEAIKPGTVVKHIPTLKTELRLGFKVVAVQKAPIEFISIIIV
jgi:hypothetical protein